VRGMRFVVDPELRDRGLVCEALAEDLGEIGHLLQGEGVALVQPAVDLPGPVGPLAEPSDQLLEFAEGEGAEIGSLVRLARFHRPRSLASGPGDDKAQRAGPRWNPALGRFIRWPRRGPAPSARAFPRRRWPRWPR